MELEIQAFKVLSLGEATRGGCSWRRGGVWAQSRALGIQGTLGSQTACSGLPHWASGNQVLTWKMATGTGPPPSRRHECEGVGASLALTVSKAMSFGWVVCVNQ